MKFLNKILFFLFVSISFHVSAQQDPEAKKILDQFSKKTKAYGAFKLGFVFITENHQTKTQTEEKGTVLIKGNKYKMEINNMEIYFDGKDIYNYLKDSKEVNIIKYKKGKDDFFLNNPSQLFTMYNKDYKYQYIGETYVKERLCYEIDLYPMDINKNYSIIKLLIDKENYVLRGAKAHMKSGIHYVIKIEWINEKADATDKDFVFDTKAHKDVEVIDMRK